MRRFLELGLATLLAVSAVPAMAAPLTLGLQETGTVQWEIETIKALGLDKQYGVEIEVRPLADSRAGQIALQAGEVDVILSDFVWVSIQRHGGGTVTMVPHSLAVGGLMVGPDSDITSVEDLKGKTIAVAGGPVDKSWVTLQAYYNSVTGRALTEEARSNFGAPPLVNELLTNGGADATLNFWQWNARAKVAGATEVLTVAQMLRELGVSEQPPLLGWTFTEETAAAKNDALLAFLNASFAAKEILLSDDDAWENLKDLMGASDDPALFERLHDDYRAGIVTHYDPTYTEPAQQAFALMAKFGGSDLVGDTQTLDPGTFWQGFSK